MHCFGAVEKVLSLIGAHHENPSFEVNSALLSRCQVYVLKPLDETNLITLLQTAIQKEYLKKKKMRAERNCRFNKHIGGDARKLLNLLEIVSDVSDVSPKAGV